MESLVVTVGETYVGACSEAERTNVSLSLVMAKLAEENMVAAEASDTAAVVAP
jgi:hypothetical protein